MDTIAAITTAKGIAAISSIQIAGAASVDIVHKIFKPIGAKQFKLTPGAVLTGTIADDSSIIDHVVLGCLDTHCFEINCHGNPLIVEKIARLLADNGAKLLSTEDFLLAQLQNQIILFGTIHLVPRRNYGLSVKQEDPALFVFFFSEGIGISSHFGHIRFIIVTGVFKIAE